ncbi:MAG: 23S rRNA (adenine(2503)-C(2))-methyltransferase RlmN [Desulfosarcina sp.]
MDYTHDQFVDAFRRRYGKGAQVSTALYRQIMKTGNAGFDRLEAFKNLPELAGRLKRKIVCDSGRLVRQVDAEGVVKFVTRLSDGLEVESVVIPMFRRYTLCVSSQVGCRMGCRFCETGRMGLLRDLTASEIVGQLFTARHQLGYPIRNVVFMGMGEPLDNLDQVIGAIRVMEDQRGLDIARRHITVSTAGLTAGIDRLARIEGQPVNLAISINAPVDDIRDFLMPINRANPLAALRASLKRYPLTRKSTLFFEYVLIEGLNDRQEHALALARYLNPLKAKLNLIPYNPSPGSDFHPPSVETHDRFRTWLVAERVFVRNRHSQGERIMAACGQLGGTSPRQT